ncbi:hypothetical protein UK23_35320 [Lentzea aerocolonigenes]|uniref:Uncharacterized protein n=2 Tax=Lentzea aerocolonigenes TaxID=68170 RepID=A0A0F0GJY6_LENAE|nr:hypothetical protein UK23_35320 [Lentzea aerocolonigenes]
MKFVTGTPMPIEKVIALSDEVDATASLLRHGLRVLESYAFAARDADVAFVCLAGGAEKLLKLSTGLHALDTSGSWPPKAVMTGIGHDIVKLYDHVRDLIVQEAPSLSTAPGLIAELLDKVDNDPHIDQVLEVLGTYAKKGRFYNLDHLADHKQSDDSPKQLWEALHQGLLKLHPPLLMQLASVGQSQAARAELNKLIICSITDWQELITRAWRTGVFGSLAKQWAPLLLPT